MNLALFDLDNTLLTGDSDFEWAQFLISKGVVDRELQEAKNIQFYEQYKAGTLDIYEFLNFQLAPLARHAREELARQVRRRSVRGVGQRVAAVEEVPQRAVDLPAGVDAERDAGVGDAAALLRDLLALVALQPGEEVEWESLDRGELHLVRPHAPPPRARGGH